MERAILKDAVIAWVGTQILPHEAELRLKLRRSVRPEDLEDVIQEAYCRIASLTQVSHIRNGRAYLFTTARMIVLERLRRARIVQIETVSELDAIEVSDDMPSPERIAGARRELQLVRELIAQLPDRCRRIVELRKIEGLSQREIAQRMGVSEHVVENDVTRGLKQILKIIDGGEQTISLDPFKRAKCDERSRNRRTNR